MKEWVDRYPWKSVVQKEGFLALLKDLRDSKPARELHFTEEQMEVFAWFIQKDHESNQWWDERVCALAKRFEDDLVRIQIENRELRGELQRLKSRVVRNGST